MYFAQQHQRPAVGLKSSRHPWPTSFPRPACRRALKAKFLARQVIPRAFAQVDLQSQNVFTAAAINKHPAQERRGEQCALIAPIINIFTSFGGSPFPARDNLSCGLVAGTAQPAAPARRTRHAPAERRAGLESTAEPAPAVPEAGQQARPTSAAQQVLGSEAQPVARRPARSQQPSVRLGGYEVPGLPGPARQAASPSAPVARPHRARQASQRYREENDTGARAPGWPCR